MKKAATTSAALVVVMVVMGAASPASAEVVTRDDPNPACSQQPALDVKRTTFNYDTNKFVWRIKMGALSKQRTRVFARYTLGNRSEDRYDVVLTTRFDAEGNKRVVGHWSDYITEDYGNRFTDGLAARWNWKQRVITFTLTSHVKGQRANAWAYSIAKGRQEGPTCGDYIWSTRIGRG